MTNQNLTHLVLISDRSGSMSQCREDAEGGINAFLDEHKKASGDCNLTFVQFDTEFDTVFDGAIKDMGKYELRPRGRTALLDAIGMTVTRLGERFAAQSEDDRPGSVIVLISTDGYENASRDWTKDKVKELLEKQQGQWQWRIDFIGANIDAVGEASSLGINVNNAMQFDTKNSGSTYAAAATNSVAYRGAVAQGISAPEANQQTSWTEEQRKDAMKK